MLALCTADLTGPWHSRAPEHSQMWPPEQESHKTRAQGTVPSSRQGQESREHGSFPLVLLSSRGWRVPECCEPRQWPPEPGPLHGLLHCPEHPALQGEVEWLSGDILRGWTEQGPGAALSTVVPRAPLTPPKKFNCQV